MRLSETTTHSNGCPKYELINLPFVYFSVFILLMSETRTVKEPLMFKNLHRLSPLKVTCRISIHATLMPTQQHTFNNYFPKTLQCNWLTTNFKVSFLTYLGKISFPGRDIWGEILPTEFIFNLFATKDTWGRRRKNS
mgnify:CR=1 FL=1